MHRVPIDTPSHDFIAAWSAAGSHLQSCIPDGSLVWLKARLEPPFLEHLSFRIGNQLFFVRLEAEDGSLEVPGSREGLEQIARGCKGHACLLTMRATGEEWRPAKPAWGLTALDTGAAIDPPGMATDQQLEMTDWEVHDFAVQTVRNVLEEEGRRVMSSQGNPSVDPSIWFVGDSGPEWVVVRVVRYPASKVTRPANWESISRSCGSISSTGHFASVSVASKDQNFEEAASATPLWRGHGMYVSYQGLS